MSRSTFDVERIVLRYIAVWNEPDPAAREHAVAELWTPDGVEFVEGARFTGHKGLADRVREAHELFVATGDHRVTYGRDLTVHADVARFTIQLTRAKAPHRDEVAWAARVFLHLDEAGRIREDYHLTVQPLPAA